MVTKSKVKVEEKKYPKVTLEISAAKKAVVTLRPGDAIDEPV